MKAKRTCGSCIFFGREIPNGEKKLHRDAGHKPYGKPCMKYEVDPFELVHDSKQLSDLAAIAKVANGLPPSAAQNLAQVLTAIPLLHRAGFQFMQRVAYRWRGYATREYLNNWLVAHVLSINADLTELRLVSYNGEVSISVPRRSVKTMIEWEPIRKRLIKAGRLWDPEYGQDEVPVAPANIDKLAARTLTLDSISEMEDARLLLPKTGKFKLGGKKDKTDTKKSKRSFDSSFRIR